MRPAASPASAGQDLHSQSADALLSRDFGDPGLSYLLLDEAGRIVSQRWENSEDDLPVGSLTKPFMAVAYGRTHGSFPEFRCIGKKTCWLARGHGRLGVTEAIAVSCNSYFHQLAAAAGGGFGEAMKSFELHPPGSAEKVHSATSAAPLSLARAYLELTKHPAEPSIRAVLRGLALSAQKGTAKSVASELVSMTALAKTGTAECMHRKKASGDGFALVMAPADRPRVVLLVRVHARPGYIAAGIAGRMIAEVESNGVSK